MATSTLVVYEPLDNFKEDISYWEEYCKFYEEYWGGPTSPFGVWFGNEYNAFRKALSNQLNLEDSEINDCFFLKKGEDQYFVAPLRAENNILSVNNFIPPEWFFLFSQKERRDFYTHWGFNTINYDADLQDSLTRLINAIDTIEKFKNKGIKVYFAVYIDMIFEGLNHIKDWLSGFGTDGVIILNYGDICSHIYLQTLKNEDSVGDMNNLLEYLKDGKYNEAESLLKIFNQKWEDINSKCVGNVGTKLLQ